MSKWEEKRLGDIAPFIYGKALTAEKRISGKYNVFSSGGVCGKSDNILANKGIIVGRKGSAGSLYYSNEPFFCIDTAFYIDEVKKGNEIKFVYYYMKLLNLEKFNNDAAVPGLNRNLAHKLKIRIPDLPIQEHIADILSTYDDLIENNNRRIELLEKSAQELYKEWFVRFRFPNHENTKFVNGLPEGWEVKKLGDLVTFAKGKNITKGTVVLGNVPVIAGGIEPSCYHNQANTVSPVITVSASGANAGYIKFNYVDVWASDCSYIDNTKDNIYFFYELLNSMRVIINNLQVGSAQPHVYPKDLNKIKVMKPELELIKLSNAVLEKFHCKIAVLHKQNQNLKKQRDLLLPRLMSGKLEV